MPPVSQDIQAFCDELPSRVQAKVDAAVTAALTQATTDAQAAQAKAVADALAQAATDAQAAQDKAVADAVSQVQQDHADEVTALKAALDEATGPDAGGSDTTTAADPGTATA